MRRLTWCCRCFGRESHCNLALVGVLVCRNGGACCTRIIILVHHEMNIATCPPTFLIKCYLGVYTPPAAAAVGISWPGGYNPPRRISSHQEACGFKLRWVIWRNLDLGKNRFQGDFYICIKMIFFQNQSFKIDLCQTAPPKMTAMTIGSY